MADLAPLLAAAKRAVRVASRLALSVSARGLAPCDAAAKPDASPVTVADYGAQAALNVLLLHALQGEGAVRALLGGAPAPAAFRVLGEESAAGLAGCSAGLQAAVLAAFAGAMAPRAELAGGGGGGEWSGGDVLQALGAGSCAGGRASEGAGEGRGYWVMDPIDGTKGFLRGGQYAVGLAFIRDGAPVLAVMACPALPYPAWPREEAPAPAPTPGALFAATAGGGATQEPLFGAAGAGEALPQRISCARQPPRASAELTLCESFEAGHSSHSASEAVAAALGLARQPIRMDSMGKYALVARGCGDLYFRCAQWGARERSAQSKPANAPPHPSPTLATPTFLPPLQNAPRQLQRVRVGPRPWLAAADRGGRHSDGQRGQAPGLFPGGAPGGQQGRDWRSEPGASRSHAGCHQGRARSRGGSSSGRRRRRRQRPLGRRPVHSEYCIF